jgi:hypothetical protein
MTVRVQLPSIGRYDLFQHTRTREITVWDDDQVVGVAFPEVPADPDSRWYGRRRGEAAVPRPTQEAALAYVTGQPIREED